MISAPSPHALPLGADDRARRAVVDTNVLLDFWVFDDRVAQPLRALVEAGELTVVRSGATVDELADVLARDKLRIGVDARFELLRRWDRLATPIDRIFASRLTCTDRHDQKFLDLAVSADAGWLVTKDKALLKLARRARVDGLRIVKPVELLAAWPPFPVADGLATMLA